jgi:hypothetical protein
MEGGEIVTQDELDVEKLRADDLAAELEFMRKNDGFTERRLNPTGMLAEVLREKPDDSFERIRSRFLSSIHAGSDEDQALLLDVFALSPETADLPRLMERRRIHGARIGRSAETVADRERPALERLFTRLVTGRYPQSPVLLEVPEMHNGIIYQTTSTLIVVEKRRWKEKREHYRFIATFDEMDYLTITRSYDAITTAEPGGAFKVNTRTVPGAGWNDHFWHLDSQRAESYPMRRGEMYDLRFTVRPPAGGADQEPITLASRAFHERSLLASIQVAFAGERPEGIWKFEGVSPYARPTEGAAHSAVNLDSRNAATLRVRDAHGGLFSGLAWSWARESVGTGGTECTHHRSNR